MTHVPAYYRARRDAERAWRASHPQYTIEGFQDALDEADVASGVGLVERVVEGDGPSRGDVTGRSDTTISPRAVPPSHEPDGRGPQARLPEYLTSPVRPGVKPQASAPFREPRGLTSGAGPCRDQWVRPDGSTGLVAAADDCSSASAPSTPAEEVTFGRPDMAPGDRPSVATAIQSASAGLYTNTTEGAAQVPKTWRGTLQEGA